MSIGGQQSDCRWIKTGVPQISNLGHFLFNLYTQEMSSVLCDSCTHVDISTNYRDIFDQECDKCSLLISFADDDSIVLQSKGGQYIETSRKLDLLHSKLELFIKSKGLQLNINKTQLLHVTPRQQIVANSGENILLEVLDKDENRIKPKSAARILGLTVN